MIDQIRLVGCQSWEDTTIKLATDKINIIQAPNNTGKSVLFKILKISVAPKIYTARKRKKLIRNGCAEARAFFSFTDGCIAATVIQQTRVIYLFRENGSNSWESFVEPPRRMIDELGLLVNEKGTFIANIIDTDQNLLLVDSDAASTTEFINMLCNNATLDDYKEKVEAASSWTLNNIVPVEWELEKVNRELKDLEYVDIDRMQHGIDLVMVCKNSLYGMIELLSCVQKLSGVLRYAKNYDELLTVEGMLETVEAIKFEECKVSSFDERTLQLCHDLETVEAMDLHVLEATEEPPRAELLSVLEAMERIQLADLKRSKEVPSVELVDALGKSESVLVQAENLQRAMSAKTVAKESINTLEEEFRNSGTVHKCEIYGEVVFNGKECVPCDS